MSTLDIILALISVISFGLAIFSFVRNELKKAHEQTNVETMKERLRALSQGLETIFQATNALVQIPKGREISVEVMQDIARLVRAQIFLLSDKTKKERLRLDDWQFGVILKSEVLEDNNIEDQAQAVAE
jgi:hypothetical protein